MEIGDITVGWNIFYAMKHSMEQNYVFKTELLSELVNETYYELFSTDFPSVPDLMILTLVVNAFTLAIVFFMR